MYSAARKRIARSRAAVGEIAQPPDVHPANLRQIAVLREFASGSGGEEPWHSQRTLSSLSRMNFDHVVIVPAKCSTRHHDAVFVKMLQGLKRKSAEWIGRAIFEIGKATGVVVSQVDASKQHPAKFASTHYLRRSRLERLRDEGVPREIIHRFTRHASSETMERYCTPGENQKKAAKLRELLVAADSQQPN